jgi:hypothetical protein
MLFSVAVWWEASAVISWLNTGIMGLNPIQGIMNVCFLLCLCCTLLLPSTRFLAKGVDCYEVLNTAYQVMKLHNTDRILQFFYLFMILLYSNTSRTFTQIGTC